MHRAYVIGKFLHKVCKNSDKEILLFLSRLLIFDCFFRYETEETINNCCTIYRSKNISRSLSRSVTQINSFVKAPPLSL
jgi:hypothetical protein